MQDSLQTGESPDTALDYAIVEALRDLAGTGFLSELVESFVVDAERVLGLMRRAIACRDLARLQGLAHELKGSSAAVGGAGLSRLCEAIEGMSGPELWAEVCRAAERAAEALRITSERLREEAARSPGE
jgi:HPt (histidine-containing phosphotransfer) domain-containing protein